MTGTAREALTRWNRVLAPLWIALGASGCAGRTIEIGQTDEPAGAPIDRTAIAEKCAAQGTKEPRVEDADELIARLSGRWYRCEGGDRDPEIVTPDAVAFEGATWARLTPGEGGVLVAQAKAPLAIRYTLGGRIGSVYEISLDTEAHYVAVSFETGPRAMTWSTFDANDERVPVARYVR